jgi:hypothetical protein
MTKRMFSVWGVALLGLVAFPTSTTAGPIQKIDFAGTGGTVAYTQNVGNPFLAVGGVGSVIGLPAGKQASVGGGMFNLQTGGCNAGANCYTPNGADTLMLTFSNSGTNGITITGSVFFGAGSPFNIPAGSTLMTGELVNTSAVIRGPSAPMPTNCSASQHAAGQCGPDTGGLSGEIDTTFVNPSLLKGLGLLPANMSNPPKSIEQLNFILMGIIFGPNQTIGGIGNTMDSSVTLTDFSLTLTPEPTSLLLFGSGLLFATEVLRRKLASR